MWPQWACSASGLESEAVGWSLLGHCSLNTGHTQGQESKGLQTTTQAQTLGNPTGHRPEPGSQVGTSHQVSRLLVGPVCHPVPHQSHQAHTTDSHRLPGPGDT